MRYTLAEPPKMDNEAFNALEGAFGADNFSQEDAVQVIVNTLNVSYASAVGSLRSLINIGSVAPDVSDASIAPTRPPVLRPSAPVRPPVEEEDRDLTIGEASPEQQAKYFGEIG